MDALYAQRDRLLDDLAQVHSRIQALQQRSAQRSTVSTTAETSALLEVTNPAKSPASKDQDQQLENLPVEKVPKLALALLLKHRGGPGFGHGRLQVGHSTALFSTATLLNRAFVQTGSTAAAAGGCAAKG